MVCRLTRRSKQWKHGSEHASRKTVGCQCTGSVIRERVHQKRENAREDKDDAGIGQSKAVQYAQPKKELPMVGTIQ
jgi:hypothetical protein